MHWRAFVAHHEGDNFAYAAEQLATAAMARQESALLQDKQAREREAKVALHRAETAEMEAERARQLAQSPKWTRQGTSAQVS